MTVKSSDLFENRDQLTEEEIKIINECIPVIEYKKGTVLLRAGDVSKEAYQIVSGCIRSYFLVDGEEKTTAFYIENESCAALYSFTNQVPSNNYLECVEDCVLAVMTYEKEQELIKRYPPFESLCRAGVEKDFGNTQEALAKFIASSPEERYLNLLETRPELLQRIPQYQLASYLGIKPESLSRIRKRVALKSES